MSNFTTIPVTQVREGEVFTPIEKMGAVVFNPKRRKFERKWIISPKSYVMVGRLHGLDQDGKDGLFALGDWAIVCRSAPASAPRAAETARGVDRLLAKYGARR